MGLTHPMIRILAPLVAILAILYFGAFFLGRSGYGYAGYGGYHHGPSFWYWGGARTYHDPSVRTGSRGGPGVTGGGTGGGGK